VPHLEALHHLTESKQLSELSVQITSDVLARMNQLIYEDAISKPDYALSALGAQVVDYTGKWSLNRFINAVALFNEQPHPPSTVLQAGNVIGQCWAFAGSQAFITIQLSKTILPDSISVDHIAPAIAHVPNVSSAPREIRVLGFTSMNSRPVLLGTFEYDRTGEQVQNFAVNVSLSGFPTFSMLVASFLSC
jgi:SUN domain-containing protein 1/2